MTRDETKRAAADMVAICEGLGVYKLSMLDIARAYLAQCEREEKALEALREAKEAMTERRLYGDAWERKYGDKWDEQDAQIDAAIKAIEEGIIE